MCVLENDGGFFFQNAGGRENEDVCRFYYWVNIENKYAVFFSDVCLIDFAGIWLGNDTFHKQEFIVKSFMDNLGLLVLRFV